MLCSALPRTLAALLGPSAMGAVTVAGVAPSTPTRPSGLAVGDAPSRAATAAAVALVGSTTALSVLLVGLPVLSAVSTGSRVFVARFLPAPPGEPLTSPAATTAANMSFFMEGAVMTNRVIILMTALTPVLVAAS